MTHAAPGATMRHMAIKRPANAGSGVARKPRRTATGRRPSVGKGLSESGMRVSIFGSTDPTEIRRQITDKALPTSKVVSVARSVLGLTVNDVSKVIAASPRTLERRSLNAKPLEVSEADRVYRLARIYDLAVDMIGDRAKAARWLHSAHRFLGGETPLAMIETEVGTHAVEQSLYAIAYGGVG